MLLRLASSSPLFGTLSDIVHYSDYYLSHCAHDKYCVITLETTINANDLI